MNHKSISKHPIKLPPVTQNIKSKPESSGIQTNPQCCSNTIEKLIDAFQSLGMSSKLFSKMEKFFDNYNNQKQRKSLNSQFKKADEFEKQRFYRKRIQKTGAGSKNSKYQEDKKGYRSSQERQNYLLNKSQKVGEKEYETKLKEQKCIDHIVEHNCQQESKECMTPKQKAQLISLLPSQTDYKDRLQSVRMIDFDNLVQSSKKKYQSQKQLKPKQTLDDIIQKQFASQFARWTTTLLDTICKSSFYGFLHKSMDKTTTKVYFSRNCIHNVILMKQQLAKRDQLGSKYGQKLIQMLNKQSTSSLKFLKLKYPQQEKVLLNDQISNMISKLQVERNYDRWIPKSLGFQYKTFNVPIVKQFLNSLINETDSKSQLFKSNPKMLFRNQQNKDMSSLSAFNYIIGTKLETNTPKYSKGELEQKNMQIKSGQIMRIIIKWIQNLQENAKQIQTYMKDHQMEWIYEKDVEQIYKSLNWIQNNDKKQSLRTLNQFMTKILQHFLENQKNNFQSVDQDECKTNIFTLVSSIELENNVLKYLFELLEHIQKLMKAIKIHIDGPVPFQIFDLFRGKCSGSYQEIKQVHKNLKKSKVFKIIQVKNRINTPNRDYLVNMTMQGTSLICQLQLHINIGSKADQIKQHRSNCENDFNHFLYQLERSKFGPLAEMVSVYSLNSDLPGFFSINKLNSLRNRVNKKKFDQNITVSNKYQIQLNCNGPRKTFVEVDSQINQKLLICDYCFKVSYNDSSIKYWRLQNSQHVCEVCMAQKLSIQDLKKLFFKKQLDHCEHIQNMSQIQLNLKENCDKKIITLIDKISHKKQKYLSHWIQQFKFKKLGTKIEINTNNFKQEYLKNKHIFLIEYTKTETKNLSECFHLIPRQDYQILRVKEKLNPKYNVNLICLTRQDYQKIQILALEIKLKNNDNQIDSLLFDIQKACSNKSYSLIGTYSYTIFKFIPRQLQNRLTCLDINKPLKNFPILNLIHLEKLSLQIQCELEDLQFDNLQLNNSIRQLAIKLNYHNKDSKSNQQIKEQIFDVSKLKSHHLSRFKLEFQNYKHLRVIICNKFDHISRNQEYNQLDLEKSQENKKKKYHLANFEQLKQLEIITRQVTNSTIDFNDFIHQGLQKLEIEASHQILINFAGTKLNNLKEITVNLKNKTNQVQYYSRIKGFDEQNLVELFSIEKFSFKCIKDTDLSHFPVQNLNQYNHFASYSNQQQCNSLNLKLPIEFCKKLKRLQIEDFNYNEHLRIDNGQSIEYLELREIKKVINSDQKQDESKLKQKYHMFEVMQEQQSLKQSSVEPGQKIPSQKYAVYSFKNLYPCGLWNLKRLILRKNNIYRDSMQALKLSQKMDQLEHLQIKDYSDVQITSELKSLKRLQFLSCQFKTIDLSSIISSQLHQIIFQQIYEMKSIKLNLLQVATVKYFQFDSDVPQFEGVELKQKYFWSLEKIKIGRTILAIEDLNYWREEQVQEEGQNE